MQKWPPVDMSFINMVCYKSKLLYLFSLPIYYRALIFINPVIFKLLHMIIKLKLALINWKTDYGLPVANILSHQ